MQVSSTFCSRYLYRSVYLYILIYRYISKGSYMHIIRYKIHLKMCVYIYSLNFNGCFAFFTLTCVLSRFSRVQLFATPWTVALQAPLSMAFSRQEYWSGLPCPPPRDLPDPGMEPVSCASCIGRQVLYHWAPQEACVRDATIQTPEWKRSLVCSSLLVKMSFLEQKILRLLLIRDIIKVFILECVHNS